MPLTPKHFVIPDKACQSTPMDNKLINGMNLDWSGHKVPNYLAYIDVVTPHEEMKHFTFTCIDIYMSPVNYVHYIGEEEESGHN